MTQSLTEVDRDALAELERMEPQVMGHITFRMSPNLRDFIVNAARQEPRDPQTLDDPKDRALLNALEAMTTLCCWFGEREAGKPTTNSEAAMFARCDQASSMLEALYGLDLPDTSQPHAASGLKEGEHG